MFLVHYCFYLSNIAFLQLFSCNCFVFIELFVSAFLRVLVGKILVVPRQSLVGGSLSTRGEDKSDGVVKVKACCRFEFDIGMFIYAAEYMGNKFTGKASILLANCLTNTLRDECELEEKTEDFERIN